MTFLIHDDGFPLNGWRWTIWSSECDGLVASGYADNEDLAEFAADSVCRLLEGTC